MDGHVCRLFSCHDFLHFYCKCCYSLIIYSIWVSLYRRTVMCFAFLRRRKYVSFHKGTIKTLQSYVCGTISKQFQFHKGTIMTSSVSRTWRVITCFNSIKVRLRLSRHRSVPYRNKFQFHKGTIKTSQRRVTTSACPVSIP